MFSSLEQQRRLGSTLLVGLLWVHVLINATAVGLLGEPWLRTALMSAAVAGAATLHWRLDGGGAGSRMTVAVALMVTISLLVAGVSGHAWQVDVHMYYFAALALLMIYCDWRVILVGAATVAVHHLLLNAVLPAAVYPGGGDFGRVVLHAVILLAEAAVLMLGSRNLVAIFEASEASAGEARAALDQAQKAEAAETAARAAARTAEESRAKTQVQVERERAQVMTVLADALERVAARDLSFELSEPMPPEYEKLRADFNRALGELHAAMVTVSEAADAIRSGSGEVTHAADTLSQRTAQQAARLEETAAAVEDLTKTVRRTAQGARRASEAVSKAKTDAEQSGDVVRDAVAAMGQIEQSARQINQITGVIDEIAFQTNLLALNAGVEAARAGDAGKGFAVVASEVRALAQRSAAAAKEIKTLIQDSDAHVSAGVDLVGRTGQSLERILTQVGEITGLVADIAASAEEQASGLEDINQTVTQMDGATQQNAAMVEESTTASHALAQEADGLNEMIGRFDLGAAAAALRRQAA